MKTYEFANGPHSVEPGKTRIEAAGILWNEDWKTATAHNQRKIQKGEQGTLDEPIINFYGSFARVKFDDVGFQMYVKWSDINFLS
jgi:hypothetical protein